MEQKENNIEDIKISANNDYFDYIGLEILKHENSFRYENGKIIELEEKWTSNVALGETLHKNSQPISYKISSDEMSYTEYNYETRVLTFCIEVLESV